MRKLLSICALLLFALSPAVARAADITGTWTGAMWGPDGNADFQLSFTFKQDGAKFTGSVQGRKASPSQSVTAKSTATNSPSASPSTA